MYSNQTLDLGLLIEANLNLSRGNDGIVHIPYLNLMTVSSNRVIVLQHFIQSLLLFKLDHVIAGVNIEIN